MTPLEKPAPRPLYDAVAGLGEALAGLGRERSPEESDPHETELMKSPVHTNFGDFKEKLTYVGNVNPGGELDPTAPAVTPVGVILAAVETDDGRKRIVQLGHREATEEQLEKFGNKVAGNLSGEYVMYVEEGSKVTAIVLGSEEMPKLIRHNEEIRFGTDHTSHSVAGKVQRVVAFR